MMRHTKKAMLLMVALLLVTAACAERSPYRYWNSYSLIAPEESNKKSFTDASLSIRFWIDEKKIHFTLKNKSEFPLVIHWKEARFVNLDTKKHALANGTTLFTKNRRSPAPTTIDPGEEITDFIAPVGNVKKLEEWTWYLYPLFNLQTDTAPNNKGKTFGIDLPISRRGITRSETVTYSFRFRINNVLPIASTNS